MTLIFTVLWICFALSFFVIEGFALHYDKTHPTGDLNKNGIYDDGFTLSAHLRRWFSLKSHLGRSAFLVVFGGFATWFVFHILGQA